MAKDKPGEMPPDETDYAQKAWVCLDKDATPRKQVIGIIQHPWFDNTVLFLILGNCITMMVSCLAAGCPGGARTCRRY